MQGLQLPTSPLILRSLHPLCNVFQRSSSNFARIAVPLNQHLRNDQPETLTPLCSEEIHAMESHRNALDTSADSGSTIRRWTHNA